MSLSQSIQEKINSIIATRQNEPKISLNDPVYEDLYVYFGVEPQTVVEVISTEKKIYLGKDQ